MSYILEALRKAEAERQRGAVPDLHAQMLPAGAPGAALPASRPPAWVWLAGVGLLVASVAAAWLLLGRQEAPERVAAPAAVMPPPSPPSPPAPVAAVAAPVAPAPTAAQAPPATPAPLAAVAAAASQDKAPAVRKAAPARRDAAPSAKPAATRTKPAQATASADDPTAATAAAPAPAAAAARVPALAELPGELRQQVPPLAIGGSVYSPQASARMVVVNGQVFQEGSTLTPELKLEQIRPKSAVFTIRGQRFEMPL